MGSNKTESMGKRIQTLREGAGMTQSALAKATGVSRETINHWESDAREIKATQLLKLSELFKVTCDFILRGVETKNVDIHTKTGLSDKAINLLVTAKRQKEVFQGSNNPYKYYFSDALNLILEYINYFPELEHWFIDLLNKDFNIDEREAEDTLIDKDTVGLLDYIHRHGEVVVGGPYRSLIIAQISRKFDSLISDLSSTINPSFIDINSSSGNRFLWSTMAIEMGDTIIDRMRTFIDYREKNQDA
jgi:transcriptional regulator with XRE-family HTH domain